MSMNIKNISLVDISILILQKWKHEQENINLCVPCFLYNKFYKIQSIF